MTLEEQTTTIATETEAIQGKRVSHPRLGFIDSDMHPTVRTIGEIKPFLTERWWRYLQSYGPRPKHGFAEGDPYPKAAPRAARRDAWGPNGAQPGSDLDFTRKHYLDAYNIEHSIMAPLQPTGQADRNLDFSAAISSAVNDWQRAKWTEPEPRFKASIVIPL